MFAVKKVTKNEYAHLKAESGNLRIHASHGRGWAVIDENGTPICHKNHSGEPMFDVFDRKGTAQMQADWMNEKGGDIELLLVEKHKD